MLSCDWFRPSHLPATLAAPVLYRILYYIAPTNLPLSPLPGSPELLIFSPLDATAVAKG